MTHCHVVFQTGGCLYIAELDNVSEKRDTWKKMRKTLLKQGETFNV